MLTVDFETHVSRKAVKPQNNTVSLLVTSGKSPKSRLDTPLPIWPATAALAAPILAKTSVAKAVDSTSPMASQAQIQPIIQPLRCHRFALGGKKGATNDTSTYIDAKLV